MDVDQSNVHGQPHVILGDDTSAGHAGQARASMSASALDAKDPQDSLTILADVASTQVSPDHTEPPPRRQLSSAPQTKAEQQRQALKKFSKAIVGEIKSAHSAEEIDLENAVLRVLYGVAKSSRGKGSMDPISLGSSTKHPTGNVDAFEDAGMTKAEALKASQAISNLIKQSGNLPSAPRPRRVPRTHTSNKIKCDICGAFLARSCDMKKHMKRHTKPYGCTYPKCLKRFGAKSDWKRHENSQHFQLESFRCCLPLPLPDNGSASSKRFCTAYFQRHELFEAHLTKDHQFVSREQIEKTMKERRIGKNGQGQFWCGFCGEAGMIVKLREKRNAAWDERFDHIDKHFREDHCSIDDWICVEEDKKKGLLKKVMDRTNFDEGEDELEDTEDSNSPPGPESQPAADPEPSSSTEPAPTTTRKRHAEADDSASILVPKRRKRDLSRYCCACDTGPWNNSMYVYCINCDHRLCSGCPVGTVGNIEPDANFLM